MSIDRKKLMEEWMRFLMDPVIQTFTVQRIMLEHFAEFQFVLNEETKAFDIVFDEKFQPMLEQLRNRLDEHIKNNYQQLLNFKNLEK